MTGVPIFGIDRTPPGVNHKSIVEQPLGTVELLPVQLD